MKSPANKKIYIMSVAASGKSSFSNKHPVFRGYRVIDVYDLLPHPKGLLKLLIYLSRGFTFLKRFTKHSAPEKAKTNSDEYVLNFLLNTNDPVVVLGNRGPNDLASYSQIQLGVVIIPEEQHRENTLRRKSQLRNPIPFFHHRSTNFNEIIKMRENLINYASQQKIQIYESFDEAIDDLA